MRYVFISPHMDDVVCSAGDYILGLKKKKEKVFIITVFTEFGKGPLSRASQEYINSCNIPHLNKFSRERKNEDLRAMEKLGVKYCHLGFIDAAFRLKKNSFGSEFIYPFYNSHCLFSGKVALADKALLSKIWKKLKKLIRRGDILYGPLAIGNHVDHLIIRKLLLRFVNKKYFWVDQPYINEKKGIEQLRSLKGRYKKAFTVKKTFPKKEILSCYSSQIKYFFPKGIKLQREVFFTKA